MSEASALLDAAWVRLAEGAAPGRSPWSMVQLATKAQDGRPRVRTVVLRHADAARRLLRVHTDARSSKCREIEREPLVALHGVDLDAGFQIRIEGRAALLRDGPIHDAAWAATPDETRALYRSATTAGADYPPDAGRENFVVVEVEAFWLDALDLAEDGWRRASFSWTTSGWSGGWVSA